MNACTSSERLTGTPHVVGATNRILTCQQRDQPRAGEAAWLHPRPAPRCPSRPQRLSRPRRPSRPRRSSRNQPSHAALLAHAAPPTRLSSRSVATEKAGCAVHSRAAGFSRLPIYKRCKSAVARRGKPTPAGDTPGRYGRRTKIMPLCTGPMITPTPGREAWIIWPLPM